MPSTIYYPGYSQVNIQQNLRVQTIDSITNAYPMVVTTVNDHDYPAGVEVTFLIPPIFGMTQLNNQIAQVLSVTSKTLTINLDSRNFEVFAYPSSLAQAYTPPSVIPVSSGPPIPPIPLPYGNENAFLGTIFNSGQV